MVSCKLLGFDPSSICRYHRPRPFAQSWEVPALVEMGSLQIIWQSVFQISRFTDILYTFSYSNRDFFKIASACPTCRSIFVPVPACRIASYTPSYPENSHMAREAMKPADIPKWAVRDPADNIDLASSSPHCALPFHPIPA